MKALVYTGPEKMQYRDEPDPVAGDGETLVRIDAVGVCGSDMHAYLGHDERRLPPLILGHEASGEVMQGPRAGRKVVLNPIVTCGVCVDCLEGRPNICGRREIISMAPRQGAFAQFISVPERNLLEIPDDMAVTKAALAEPIATAWHGVAMAAKLSRRPLAECRVLSIGAGAVGLAAALVLRAQGARQSWIAETNPGRRATAERQIEAAIFDPSAAAAGPEEGTIHVVIDAVGGRLSREFACRMVRPGGLVVHIGLQDSDGGLDLRRLTLQEILFAGSYTYTAADFQATIQAMHAGTLGDLDWFEERPLSDGASAFADLHAGRAAAAKIVLRPH